MSRILFQSSRCVLLWTLLVSVLAEAYHPLNPLSAREMKDTVKIIETYEPSIAQSESWIYNWITLKEPEKSLLLPHFLNDGEVDQIPRKSFTVMVNRLTNLVIEVVVNLDTREVEKWQQMPEGTQASYNGESAIAEKISKENEQIKERCRQMGWENMDLVVAEAWGPAYLKDDPLLNYTKRPMLVYFYGKMFRLDNHYAHPFDFIAVVDVAARELKGIRNLPTGENYDAKNREGNACPKKTANYNPNVMPRGFEWREVHPIHTTQSHAGYTLQGNALKWNNFKMRLGFNGREGLVIHHVSYQDGNVNRPLFYRMSLAEMFVPYADPRPPYHQKMPFDIGQFSLGSTAVNLEFTGLCKGGGKMAYLDVPLSTAKGIPTYAYSVVCIYEEDVGLLWAHVNRKRAKGNVVSRRNQRLTITTLSNLGNYDYKFSWHFYMDGGIEFKSQLNGIINTNLMAVNVSNTGGFGTVVHPQINGPFHQHIFGLRLDAEIDGNLNNVLTRDIVALENSSKSSENPYENGFIVEEKTLKTPVEARTKIDMEKGRVWLVKNPDKIHPCTKLPVGWKLTPFSGPSLFMKNDSPMFQKCAWAEYNVWVTRYKEDQLYPGGFYLDGNGLPEWVKEAPHTNLTRTDVVLWYVFGSSHITRVEDFPIMPAETIGFSLKPVNFFSKNPALNLL